MDISLKADMALLRCSYRPAHIDPPKRNETHHIHTERKYNFTSFHVILPGFFNKKTNFLDVKSQGVAWHPSHPLRCPGPDPAHGVLPHLEGAWGFPGNEAWKPTGSSEVILFKRYLKGEGYMLGTPGGVYGSSVYISHQTNHLSQDVGSFRSGSYPQRHDITVTLPECF